MSTATTTVRRNDLVSLSGQADSSRRRSLQKKSTTGGIAEKVSNAASYVAETAQEMTASARKEGHKVSLGDSDSAWEPES